MDWTIRQNLVNSVRTVAEGRLPSKVARETKLLHQPSEDQFLPLVGHWTFGKTEKRPVAEYKQIALLKLNIK